MKVLLINGNTHTPSVPPIGLEYVCEALRRDGHEAIIYDFSCADPASLPARIEFFQPAVVGLSFRNLDTGHFFNSVSYVPELAGLVALVRKHFSGPIVLGGAAYSLLPVEILENVKADFGVIGEGEVTFPLLLKNLANPSSIANVAIFDHRTGKATKTNRQRVRQPLIHPNRNQIDHRRYYELYSEFPEHYIANIQTKRGCNKNCSYCAEPFVIGREIIKRDPEDVIDEIEQFLAIGISDRFFFTDSEFNVCTTHAAAICEALIKHDLKIKWSAFVTPEDTDRSLIMLMQRAGCSDLIWSVECACDQMLKVYGKSYTAADVIRIAQICEEIDQKYTYLLLFGAPGETEQTVQETWRNVREIHQARFGISAGVRIFPSTRLAARAIEEQMIASESELIRPLYYHEEYIRNVIYPVVEKCFKSRPNTVVLGPNVKTRFDHG